MRVRIYFGKEVIWYYQVIDGKCNTNSLIYGLDRNHDKKMANYQKSLSYGLAQRPDKRDITFTTDLRKRIVIPSP